ncbi:hypothetical protein IMSAG025_01315 [Muribaculaceae bacterium]|nr:hypothetical protein IMSAGC016_01716 [Muribaculaceae bacterium]GFI57873.1 hypothetical protein IMSAG025_01315 [Muribaculaceae bacterium]
MAEIFIDNYIDSKFFLKVCKLVSHIPYNNGNISYSGFTELSNLTLNKYFATYFKKSFGSFV